MNPLYPIGAIIVVWVVFWSVERIRLRSYACRPCQGRAWKSVFPTAKKAEIRDFLGAFIDGFALPRRLKLKLSPEDKPIDIYRIVSAGIDSFEFESFGMELERKFGKGLDEKMDDAWTLGDIFRHVTCQADQGGGINSVPLRSTP